MKKYMIILRKAHATEGVSGMNKVKTPLGFS